MPFKPVHRPIFASLMASVFDGVVVAGNPISAVVMPSMNMLTAAQTPADGYVAGNYTSSAGSIVSAVPTYIVDGTPQAGSFDLQADDMVFVSVLVTDSVGNTRVFVTNVVTVSAIGGSVPSIIPDNAWDVQDARTDGELIYGIFHYPSETITKFQRQINGGAWVDLSTTTGILYTSGHGNAVQSVRIRAVNASGAGPESLPKVRTTTQAALKSTLSAATLSHAGASITFDKNVTYFLDEGGRPCYVYDPTASVISSLPAETVISAADVNGLSTNMVFDGGHGVDGRLQNYNVAYKVTLPIIPTAGTTLTKGVALAVEPDVRQGINQNYGVFHCVDAVKREGYYAPSPFENAAAVGRYRNVDAVYDMLQNFLIPQGSGGNFPTWPEVAFYVNKTLIGWGLVKTAADNGVLRSYQGALPNRVGTTQAYDYATTQSNYGDNVSTSIHTMANCVIGGVWNAADTKEALRLMIRTGIDITAGAMQAGKTMTADGGHYGYAAAISALPSALAGFSDLVTYSAENLLGNLKNSKQADASLYRMLRTPHNTNTRPKISRLRTVNTVTSIGGGQHSVVITVPDSSGNWSAQNNLLVLASDPQHSALILNKQTITNQSTLSCTIVQPPGRAFVPGDVVVMQEAFPLRRSDTHFAPSGGLGGLIGSPGTSYIDIQNDAGLLFLERIAPHLFADEASQMNTALRTFIKAGLANYPAGYDWPDRMGRVTFYTSGLAPRAFTDQLYAANAARLEAKWVNFTRPAAVLSAMTAPVVLDSYSASVTFTVDRDDGTAYLLAVPVGSPTPTDDQIFRGQNGNGVLTKVTAADITASGSITLSVSGLAASTSYEFIAAHAGLNDAMSNKLRSASFTTAATGATFGDDLSVFSPMALSSTFWDVDENPYIPSSTSFTGGAFVDANGVAGIRVELDGANSLRSMYHADLDGYLASRSRNTIEALVKHVKGVGSSQRGGFGFFIGSTFYGARLAGGATKLMYGGDIDTGTTGVSQLDVLASQPDTTAVMTRVRFTNDDGVGNSKIEMSSWLASDSEPAFPMQTYTFTGIIAFGNSWRFAGRRSTGGSDIALLGWKIGVDRAAPAL